MIETPWVVGTRPARPLAEGLGAELHELPPVVLDPEWSGARRIEEWQEAQRTAGGPAWDDRADRIGVRADHRHMAPAGAAVAGPPALDPKPAADPA